MDHLAIPQHTNLVAHLHTVSSFENLASSGRSTPVRSRSTTRERSRIRSKMLDVTAQRSDPSIGLSRTPTTSVPNSIWIVALVMVFAIFMQLNTPKLFAQMTWLFDFKRTYKYSQRPRMVHDSDSEVARDRTLDMQHAVLLTIVGTVALSFERLSELYLTKAHNTSRDLR
ncbi:hypothetical protein CKM354_000719300 [Cercospora kikuchii]|uniref:Uncharacterized protein n=1 Tax=Cercospora kikuchii TaxID=84275 RepID=A0A9P3CJI0_9PEZI|nr:uncharacterized protein CKM354_000719300 [Cercospora kikuchii]GIZ43984.1 hypothetical protein CKM354_000719300 [Cercospora kikuchii]